jgi:hypothetical protein
MKSWFQLHFRAATGNKTVAPMGGGVGQVRQRPGGRGAVHHRQLRRALHTDMHSGPHVGNSAGRMQCMHAYMWAEYDKQQAARSLKTLIGIAELDC